MAGNHNEIEKRLPNARRIRNRLLHRTRDLLLPKLISSEFDILELEIETVRS